jgi:hypothetical protein
MIEVPMPHSKVTSEARPAMPASGKSA